MPADRADVAVSAPRPLPGLHASLAAVTSRDEAWWRKYYPWPARYDPTEMRIVFHGNDEPDHVRRDVDVAAFRDGKRVGIFANAVRVHEATAEAQEALAVAGLLPEDWPARRPWFCWRCSGSGTRRVSPGLRQGRRVPGDFLVQYASCECVSRPVPDTVTYADMVAIAALGVPAILRAEAIARVAHPGASVVWAVAPRPPPGGWAASLPDPGRNRLPAGLLAELDMAGVHDARVVLSLPDLLAMRRVGASHGDQQITILLTAEVL